MSPAYNWWREPDPEPTAWKESLKRIRDGEAFERIARTSRKEMENIQAAKQAQKHKQDHHPTAAYKKWVITRVSEQLYTLAAILDEEGLRGHKAAYLREVARNIIDPLREDV